MTATLPETTLPAGYTICAPRIEDAADVAALMNASSLAESSKPTTSVDDILMYWEDPERDLDDEDWLVIAPDGRIVAFMELYEFEPYTVFEFDVHVHPEFTGLGIEPVLHRTIEERARREMHRAPDGERVVLHSYAPSTATDIQRQFETAGFVHIRDGLQMLIDLDRMHDVRWPEGIAVRSFVSNQDEHIVWETAEASWTDHWGYAPMPFEEFLYYRIESVKRFDPTLWHLAIDGSTVAGVALCLAEKAGFYDTGWVSLLGVTREYRGRGIGQALLQHVFNDFQARGYKHVGLGVDASSLTGADRLYRRAGMREIKREFIYEKVLVEGHRDEGKRR